MGAASVRVHHTGPHYSARMPKLRLDTLLAERGLFESRSRAAAAVMAGDVRLGGHGERALKPGQMVADDAEVAVAEPPPFVSRGGVKLRNALDRLGVDVSGRRCLDVGASTGGFTDCLLKRGAAEVVALDVAYGELHLSVRDDPRVTVLERTNARALRAGQLPWAPDLIVADVSFISLRKVLPAVLGAAAPAFDCLAMVKPQFELGRERVGRGGVVRDGDDRREALVAVAGFAARTSSGARCWASPPRACPVPPATASRSCGWPRPGGETPVKDLESAARTVEP